MSESLRVNVEYLIYSIVLTCVFTSNRPFFVVTRHYQYVILCLHFDWLVFFLVDQLD